VTLPVGIILPTDNPEAKVVDANARSAKIAIILNLVRIFVI
jgi:hypothetical protein